MFAVFKHSDIDHRCEKIASGLTREEAEAMVNRLSDEAERLDERAAFGTWYQSVDQKRL